MFFVGIVFGSMRRETDVSMDVDSDSAGSSCQVDARAQDRRTYVAMSQCAFAKT